MPTPPAYLQSICRDLLNYTRLFELSRTTEERDQWRRMFRSKASTLEDLARFSKNPDIECAFGIATIAQDIMAQEAA